MSDTITNTPELPAVKLLPDGSRTIDYKAIIHMAWPLFLYSGIQAVLAITDTWFISTVSVDATAAVGAIFQCINVCALFMGGLGMAVQTLVAQAHGAGDADKAVRLPWSGLVLGICSWPFFIWLAFNGQWVMQLLEISEHLQPLAIQYWQPMLLGAPVLIILWAMLGHFNGHGRTMVTLKVMGFVAIMNGIINWYYLFVLKLGVQGSAMATVSALILGMILAIVLCYKDMRVKASLRAMLPTWHTLFSVVALGIPMGIFIAFELTGFATFQLMQARDGVESSAVTQLVVMLTAACYWPMIGVGLTATTLVGQAAGANDKEWAMRVGSATVWMGIIYMTVVGILLALLAQWVVPLFVRADAENAHMVIALTVQALWIAAAFQLFDGMNLGFASALRGAGDVITPILVVLPLSWGFFLPLAHALIFAPGEGYVDFLPQYDMGVIGGWLAALVYICLLGTALWARWLSGSWKKLKPLL